MRRFEPDRLKDRMVEQLTRRQVHPESVRHVVSALMETSLRGVDSHGIKLFPHYCRAVDCGRINKDPQFKIVSRYPSAGVLDADHSFGHHAGSEAMILAMEMARQTGLGAVSVRNSTHFGAAAYYGLQASRKGYIAFAFTNADSLVKAHGSNKPFFGTNPICFTVPMRREDPLCLDMATSQVSWNKIMNFRNQKERIPPDWGFTDEGQATPDPEAVRTLNPIGRYKGYGLGMMVEILCSLLAGGPYALQLIPMFTRLDEKRYISHFFMALDIRKFRSMESFQVDLEAMALQARSLPTLQGEECVMVPGDPEKRTFQERTHQGIPVDDSTYTDFLSISKDFAEAIQQ